MGKLFLMAVGAVLTAGAMGAAAEKSLTFFGQTIDGTIGLDSIKGWADSPLTQHEMARLVADGKYLAVHLYELTLAEPVTNICKGLFIREISVGVLDDVITTDWRIQKKVADVKDLAGKRIFTLNNIYSDSDMTRGKSEILQDLEDTRVYFEKNHGIQFTRSGTGVMQVLKGYAHGVEVALAIDANSSSTCEKNSDEARYIIDIWITSANPNVIRSALEKQEKQFKLSQCGFMDSAKHDGAKLSLFGQVIGEKFNEDAYKMFCESEIKWHKLEGGDEYYCPLNLRIPVRGIHQTRVLFGGYIYGDDDKTKHGKTIRGMDFEGDTVVCGEHDITEMIVAYRRFFEDIYGMKFTQNGDVTDRQLIGYTKNSRITISLIPASRFGGQKGYVIHILFIADKEAYKKEQFQKACIAAESGDAEAQYCYGMCHLRGLGTPKNLVEGARWCRKAAEGGCVDAEYIYACLNEHGDGVEKDRTEAVKWFRIAAEHGHPAAQSEMYVVYSEGKDAPKNLKEAIRWCTLAAEGGEVAAQYNLAKHYKDGTGVEQDYEEALKWYSKAAHQGDRDAMHWLAKFYDEGLGTEKDPEQARFWKRFAMSRAAVCDGMKWGYVVENGEVVLVQSLWYGKQIVGEVVVPSTLDGHPVTVLGDSVFSRCELTKLILPDSVKVIERSACSECRNLKEVKFGKNVTTIGDSAFAKCALGELELPESLKEMGESAFVGCDLGGGDLVIPSSVTNIGVGAFGETRVRSVKLGVGLTELKNYVFANCRNLQKVTGGENIVNFNRAFHGTELIDCFQAVQMVNGVPISFEISYNETLVVGAEGKTAIPQDAKGVLALPDSIGGVPVVGIAARAMKDCTELEEVVLPKTLRRIGGAAFKGCSNLTKIHLPESVAFIAEEAFADCGRLESITLPQGLEHLGGAAFRNTAFWNRRASGPVILDGWVLGLKSADGDARDPEKGVCHVPEGVKGIAEEAFKGYGVVRLPQSIRHISRDAFEDAAIFREAKDGLVVLDGWVLGVKGKSPCSIELPEGVRGIAGSAFEDNKDLKTVKFPKSLKVIGPMAFWGSSLVEVDVPEGVESMGMLAFCDTQTTNAVVRGGVRRIGCQAFAFCEKLKEVELRVCPSKVALGANLFEGCMRLRTIKYDDACRENAETLRKLCMYTHYVLGFVIPLQYDSLDLLVADARKYMKGTLDDERGVKTEHHAYLVWRNLREALFRKAKVGINKERSLAKVWGTLVFTGFLGDSEHGRWECIKGMKEALELDPTNNLAKYELGTVYFRDTQPVEGYRLIKEVADTEMADQELLGRAAYDVSRCHLDRKTREVCGITDDRAVEKGKMYLKKAVKAGNKVAIEYCRDGGIVFE